MGRQLGDAVYAEPRPQPSPAATVLVDQDVTRPGCPGWRIGSSAFVTQIDALLPELRGAR